MGWPAWATPIYNASSMILALLPLLFLPAAEVPKAPVPPSGFTQISRQADEARTGDRLADAIRLYRQAVKLRPSWNEGWWWLGSIYYEQDRFPEAREAFARFAGMAKNPAPTYAFLGLCEYEMGDYQRASEHLRQWVEKGSPGNDQLIEVASFRWALLLTRNGRFFEALYLLGKKVEKHGPDPTLAEAMGLAWLRMRNLPEDYPPERREMVWLAGMASAYLSDLKLDRVHEFQDQLVAHYSQEPNVHYFRGYVYEFEKRYDEAAEEYRQELKISPDSAVAMVQLALMDVENAQLDEARPLAIQAISLEPKNPLAHYTLGRVLLASEKWAESARELEIARQLAPNSSRIRFHLARAYKALGRAADADRENAAFERLKGKEEVLATPKK
jgi:tetratricopeptide (TPR) repeat protein